MRWNCPHCGMTLALSQQESNTDWLYTKCFHCGGYSLVKSAPVHLLKLDDNNQKLTENPTIQTTEAILARSPKGEEPKPENKETPPPTTRVSAAPSIPTPLPSFVPETRKSNRITHSILIGLGLIAMGSGVFLFIEGSSFLQSTHQSIQSAKIESPPIQVDRNENEEKTEIITTTNAAAVIANIDQEKAKDSIESPKSLKVTLRGDFANLRSGPGLDYPVIGSAKGGQSYPVVDWDANWFKIALSTKAAWIRSDLVQTLKQVPTEAYTSK